MRRLRLKYIIQLITAILLTSDLTAQNSIGEPQRVEGISTDRFIEFAPTISADGNTMIIESNKNSKRNTERWELFESKRNKDGTWGEPIPLTAINEKCQFLAGPSLSYDGNRLFFTAFIKGATSEDIFYSERIDNTKWSEPKSVGTPINTEGYEGFPSISADGNALYFTRVNFVPLDKKTLENCFEIYVAYKQPDGEWGEPEALPSQINMGCVRDPRIMADNHTLIFSAITANGKGRYDLYQARRNVDGTWSPARALDFINSTENDQSPTIPASGDVMYYYTKNDIYSMPIPVEYRQLINVTVQGFVHTEKNGFPVLAVIEVKNLDTGEKMTLDNNPNDGRYSLVLAAGSRFRAEFINSNYVKEVLEFDLRKQDVYKEINVNVNLKSSYQVKLVAVDKDLSTPIQAFVQVTDQQGAVIWKDSLKNDQSQPAVILQTNSQYTFVASANDYGGATQFLIFNAPTFKADTTLTLHLLHDKVSVSADVTDITSNARVRTKVIFNNTNHDEVLIAESGEAVFLRKGDRYQVVTSSDKGYFFSTSSLVAGEGNAGSNGNYEHTVALTPVKEGASLTLHNITFETNSAELTKSSHAELNHVIELMRQYPNMVIEIAAHTDDVGNDKYNIKLSERRAQSVIDYLIKNGILTERFEARGYGKSKPLTSNDNEEGRALNRRVEVKVLRQ